MTRDQKIRALVKVTGMPERRATAIIDNQQLPAGVVESMPQLALPFAFTLPWSHLVSDNARYGVSGGRMILSERYKTARAAIKVLLRDLFDGRTPVAEPVELYARVFVPDKRPHDCPDFAKGVHDAIEKLVVATDSWIYRATWERAGVDVDRPRAEITISRYLTP